MTVTTVLVVDDAADIRLLVRTVLSRAGFAVVEAACGADALQLFDTQPLPDVVVLDVQMPDVDGWDTLAALRRRPEGEAVAVILLTVKSAEDDTVRAWRLGCDGFLTKPFSIFELSDEVTRVASRTPADRIARRARDLARAERATADTGSH